MQSKTFSKSASNKMWRQFHSNNSIWMTYCRRITHFNIVDKSSSHLRQIKLIANCSNYHDRIHTRIFSLRVQCKRFNSSSIDIFLRAKLLSTCGWQNKIPVSQRLPITSNDAEKCLKHQQYFCSHLFIILRFRLLDSFHWHWLSLLYMTKIIHISLSCMITIANCACAFCHSSNRKGGQRYLKLPKRWQKAKNS